MRIAVLLDRARIFRWHLALIEALTARGNEVVVRTRRASDPLPTILTVILDFDRARGHTSSERFSTHMAPEALLDLITADGEAVDVTLDLSTANAIERQAGPVVRPLYNGSVNDYALFHALLDRQAPHLAIWHSEDKHVFDIGQPAFDDALVLSRSFDQAVSRLVEGLVRFFCDGRKWFRPAPRLPRAVSSAPLEPLALPAFWYSLARAGRKVRRASDLFSGNGPRWYVAWREMGAAEQAGGVPHLARYRVLEDNGSRTFKDPCVFYHDGARHCFVTETWEATGIDTIAHLTLGGNGGGEAKSVLRTDDGVRQPCVFEADGDIWLICDRGDSGVDLYRAGRFPDEWVFTRRLISDALRGPQMLFDGGRCWLFGTSQAFQSSQNDGLTLYWAETLLGPWHAHANNPVLIDAASARAAGGLWLEGDRYIRPGQDRSNRRGGISLRRIVRLSETDYEEAVAGHIAFPSRNGLSGPMTLSRGGGLEVVDFYARPSAVRAALRSGGS